MRVEGKSLCVCACVGAWLCAFIFLEQKAAMAVRSTKLGQSFTSRRAGSDSAHPGARRRTSAGRILAQTSKLRTCLPALAPRGPTKTTSMAVIEGQTLSPSTHTTLSAFVLCMCVFVVGVVVFVVVVSCVVLVALLLVLIVPLVLGVLLLEIPPLIILGQTHIS